MVYNIPPDIKEKNKMIGGIFTVNQIFWLIGGGLIGALFFLIFFTGTKNLGFSMFFFILGILLSFPFVFYKKGDLTLWQYLVRKHQFNQKTTRLINKRVVK